MRRLARPRLVHPALRVAQRRDGQLGVRQGFQPHDGLPRPHRHPLPLRARRRLHGLRRLPLLDHQRHRPQPHLSVGRDDRPGRHRGRPGVRRRRRVGADLADVRRGAAERRGELEGLPERLGQLRRQRASPTSSSSRTPRPDRRCTYGGMSSVPSTGSTPDDIAAAIKADALAGTLPQVSWVVANQAFSEHPDAPPGDGAHFVNLVLQALNADPDVFDSTVLFLNYDENDGFFDHVPPPVPPAGTADEFYERRADRARLPGADGRRLAVEPRRLGRLAGLRPHLRHPVHGEVDRRARHARRSARASAPGAARSRGDLTGAFDFTTPVYGMPSLPGHQHGDRAGDLHPAAQPVPQDQRAARAGGGHQARPARCRTSPNGYVDRLEFDGGGQILVWLDMVNTGAPGHRARRISPSTPTPTAAAAPGSTPWTRARHRQRLLQRRHRLRQRQVRPDRDRPQPLPAPLRRRRHDRRQPAPR